MTLSLALVHSLPLLQYNSHSHHSVATAVILSDFFLCPLGGQLWCIFPQVFLNSIFLAPNTTLSILHAMNLNWTVYVEQTVQKKTKNWLENISQCSSTLMFIYTFWKLEYDLLNICHVCPLGTFYFIFLFLIHFIGILHIFIFFL